MATSKEAASDTDADAVSKVRQAQIKAPFLNILLVAMGQGKAKKESFL